MLIPPPEFSREPSLIVVKQTTFCCGIHSKELYYYRTYLLLPWDESKNLMDIANCPLSLESRRSSK